MGKDADKPRGRMSAYAFFVQTCREEHKKKHPGENVVFAEFSKKCAERWKTMAEKEKQRFLQMAEKDKKRYDSEMAGYKPAKGEKGGKGSKRKRTKDPDAPKRALSAFFWFCNDERPKVKETMPDSSVGEIAKELGRRWSDIPPEVKSKYDALAAKDKARYEKEMKTYRGGGGGGGGKKSKATAGKASKKLDSDESGEEEEIAEDDEEEEEEDDDDED